MARTAFLCFLIPVVLLVPLVVLTAAQDPPLYVEIGKNLRLDPKQSGAINSITWKHKGNIVAEYIKDGVDLEYLGDLKGRAELDLTTGILTVKDISKSDDGVFTVEINNRVLPVQFNAVGIRKLFRVEVILRPLTCNSEADRCFLVCGDEFKDAEPVQYFWKKGATGEWQKGEKSISISKDTEQLETFTCRAENLYSNVTSVPHDNPYKKPATNVVPIVVSVIVILLILAIGGGAIAWLIIKKPQWVQNLLSRSSEEPTENRNELEKMNVTTEYGVVSPPEPTAGS